MVTIPAVAACTEQPLAQGNVATSLTRLPTRQNREQQGRQHPLVAISTGRVDGLECVFRSSASKTRQFGATHRLQARAGRIRLYQVDDQDGSSNGNGGARISSNTPRVAAPALTSDQANLDQVRRGRLRVPRPREQLPNNNAGNRDQLDQRARVRQQKGGACSRPTLSYTYLFGRTRGTRPSRGTRARAKF
ncbi:MAG: hypothetical protein KF782_04900 [Labilithrix sp.]|nr:hypothetical protein [Labilithrix sp.]